MITECPRCKARGKPDHFGSDPKCAFLLGVFASDNWMCATMSALREVAEEQSESSWENDQHAIVFPCGMDDGRFLVLGWYKSRGRTEYAGVLSETSISTLDLATAEDVLRAYESKR